jgi:hypothetical protein
MRGRAFAFIRIFISCFLIFLLFWLMRDKLGEIVENLRSADAATFLYSIFVFNAAIAILAARFKRILDAEDCPIGIKDSLSLTYIGYFFNNILPTAVGGDLVKGYYVSRRVGRKLPAFTAIFMDRFVGAVTFFAVAAVALLLLQLMGRTSDYPRLVGAVWIMIGIVGFAFLFFFNRSFAEKVSLAFKPVKSLHIRERVKKVYDAVNSIKDKRAEITQIFLLSAVSQFLSFYIVYCLAAAIGIEISFIWILLVMPIVSAMSLIPSLGGLGVRESATVVFLGPMIGSEEAFSISLMWLAILFIASFTGGLIYLFDGQYRIKRT